MNITEEAILKMLNCPYNIEQLEDDKFVQYIPIEQAQQILEEFETKLLTQFKFEAKYVNRY